MGVCISSPDDEQASAELAALWPLKRFPVLVDEGRTIIEASTIIEHLELHHPGPVRLIPDDPSMALAVRMMDRVFDNYIYFDTATEDCIRQPSRRR